MADLSGFPPLMREAMQTGEMPSRDALARATGRSLEEIVRVLGEETTDEGDQALEAEEDSDPEAQRLRAKYHQLVAEASAAWLADNPTLDNRVPDDVRGNIEDMCNRQIQYEWRAHRQRFAEDFDHEHGGNRAAH